MRYGKIYYYDRLGNRHDKFPTVFKDDYFLKNYISYPQRANITIEEERQFGFYLPDIKNEALQNDLNTNPSCLTLDDMDIEFIENGLPNEVKSIKNDSDVISSNKNSKKTVDAISTDKSGDLNENKLEKIDNASTSDNIDKDLPNNNKKTSQNSNLTKEIDNTLCEDKNKNVTEHDDNEKTENTIEFNCVSPQDVINLENFQNDEVELEKELFAYEFDHICLNNERKKNIVTHDLINNVNLSVELNQDTNFNVNLESNKKDEALCSRCYLDKTFNEDSAVLKKKLKEHVDDINLTLNKKKIRKEEVETIDNFPHLEGLTEEENKEKEHLNKLNYRKELKANIEEKKQALLYEEQKNREADIAASILDAKLYAQEKDRKKTMEIFVKRQFGEDLKQQIALKEIAKRTEQARLEWWELRPTSTKMFYEENDHYLSQIRRNLALKESLDFLENFKRQQRDINEENKFYKQKTKEIVQQKISTQANLIKPSSSKQHYEKIDVFQAWEEAHLQNDRRYRVLQDNDSYVNKKKYKTELEAQKCKQCKCPLTYNMSKKFF